MSPILYLGVEQVIAIHGKAIADYGGDPGIRDRGLLEAAVHSPMWSAGLVDAYPDVFTKTAALLRSLALNHSFVDGNKRTAFVSALMFLAINGYQLKASEEDAVEFMFKVASGGERDTTQIANWLMLHCMEARKPEEAPVFDIKIHYDQEGDFSKGTMEFWVKAGFLEKKRELFLEAQTHDPEMSSFRFFKPRDHEDHVEVVRRVGEGKIRRVDYRLGDVPRNKDSQIALRFEGEDVSLSIDGKLLNPIELEES